MINFPDPQQPEKFYFYDTVYSVLVSFDEAMLSIIECRLPSESNPGFQVAVGPNRVFRVLEGALEIVVDNVERHTLQASGGILFVPGGHSAIVRNLHRELSRYEIMSCDARLEHFILRRGGAKSSQPIPGDVESIAEDLQLTLYNPPPPPTPSIKGFTIPRNQPGYSIGI
jgi:hypothetical protein